MKFSAYSWLVSVKAHMRRARSCPCRLTAEAYASVVPVARKPPLRPLAAAATLRASNMQTSAPSLASQSAAAVPVTPAPMMAISVCRLPRSGFVVGSNCASACQKDVLVKEKLLSYLLYFDVGNILPLFMLAGHDEAKTVDVGNQGDILKGNIGVAMSKKL